ncbi:oligoendopeptidase F, partial [Bacillus sp. JJ1562]|uniref:oligoendopeptidase F n=1 Tax=Bacillus sp. JJ1562 TaxID=3122960 RepID=UPI00300338CF
IYSKLYIFAKLKFDINTKVSASLELYERISNLGQKITEANSYFIPYLLSLNESTLKNYIEQVEGLKIYKNKLFNAFKFKKHTLEKKQEEILSQMEVSLSSPKRIFDILYNIDIEFGEVSYEDKTEKLTRDSYSKLIISDNRDIRKAAFKAFYEPYTKLNNTLAAIFSTSVRNKVHIAKIRNYSSAIEKELYSDEVPLEVYENLIKTTKTNIMPLQKHAEIYKKLLGLENLSQYDLSVPIVQSHRNFISYEEGFSTLVKSLEPFGEEYIAALMEFKEKRYIDVRETPGKRSGAYNIGLYGVHPFILLNYKDDLVSLFTLAHEIGHGVHSLFSAKNQPMVNSKYSTLIAEVASSVNEIMLMRYLLEKVDNEETKKQLLNHIIIGFKGSFYTQVMFAEFEKIIHEKVENGELLSAEVLNTTYENIFTTYNKDVYDEELKYGWSRIPHFYRPFHVYKYAIGYLSAMYIADKILSGDKNILDNYLIFLKSGCSKPPLELLRSIGIDLTSPEPINYALDIFSGLVDEFSSFINEYVSSPSS